MNSKHLFRFSLALFMAFATFIGCKKDPIGSVSGTLTVYDPSTPLVKTPVDSIKVYLINMDFKKDTVNPEKNRAALIDSIITDAAGKYSFTALPEGNYSVTPNFTIKHYWFVADNPDQDASFSITTDVMVHEINFTAPIPNSSNDEGRFHMTINSVNRPEGGYIKVMRQAWVLFIPYYVEGGRIAGNSGIYESSYGFTTVAASIANAWFLETWILKDGKETSMKSYFLRWELFNMPHKSTVTIDWTYGQMTIVEGQ